MNNKTACIFGGTGFIGRQIVRELAKRGVTIKVATRVPERAYFLRPAGVVGQVVPVRCDYNDADSIKKAVKGCDYVVNCIGVLYEKGGQTFQHAHVDIPARIAGACAKNNVKSFVHISALGVNDSLAKYAKSKLDGEKAVKANFPDVTILRPSVVFGEDDDFFNRFAEMARFAPALPLIGGGVTQFQPVFVGDIADAAIKALQDPETKGKTYCLGGPEKVSFKEIYQRLFEYTGRKRFLVTLSYPLAKIQARLLSLLPVPPLTPDQVELLKTDNTVSPDSEGFTELGIQPTGMDLVLPHYLETYRPGGRYTVFKAG
ncbi:MAG: complex I NDUFA9 subunit family protein [Alphaproteobacteria bacterium]|nr:complex I NDUFA9 subunit family protein [Alphaproteobacteria bacterium]